MMIEKAQTFAEFVSIPRLVPEGCCALPRRRLPHAAPDRLGRAAQRRARGVHRMARRRRARHRLEPPRRVGAPRRPARRQESADDGALRPPGRPASARTHARCASSCATRCSGASSLSTARRGTRSARSGTSTTTAPRGRPSGGARLSTPTSTSTQWAPVPRPARLNVPRHGGSQPARAGRVAGAPGARRPRGAPRLVHRRARGPRGERRGRERPTDHGRRAAVTAREVVELAAALTGCERPGCNET